MTPEERRRIMLARTGPLSSGIIPSDFYFPTQLPISDEAWYTLPPGRTPEERQKYRSYIDDMTASQDRRVLDYLAGKPRSIVETTPQPTPAVEQPIVEESAIPTLDESYDVTGRDIPEEASDQILEQIRLKALSEEAWNIEKNKLIQADNKMELAISLITGTQPNLTRLDISSGASSASNVKAQSDLERSMLVNEWMKNPPTTKDQVIEFGTKMNASPAGWTYIKNTLAPLFDYGDMITWKKLMPDGTVKYGYSRKNDTTRNQLFRNEQYRTGKLDDDRKAQEAINIKKASELFVGFLVDEKTGKARPVTQELLNEFTTLNPQILLNPDMIAAVEKIASLYDLKPAMSTFYVTEDYTDHKGILRKKGDKFSINTNTEGYQIELGNKSTTRLSEAKEFDITLSEARSQALGDASNDLQKLVDDEEIQLKDDLLLDRANHLLMERALKDPLFVIEDGDARKVLDLMEATELRTQLTGTMFDTVDTLFAEEKSHKEIKQQISKDFGKANIGDEKMKEIDEYIDGKFTQPDLAPIVATESQQVYPVMGEDGTFTLVTATTKGNVIRVGDSKTGHIDLPVSAETEAFKIYPKVILGEEADGTPKLEKVPGRFNQEFKISHMQKEKDNIETAVAALIKKPTEYWDAYNSYNQIYDQIDVGIPDPSAWASVDQRIVTLAIKLVDTSMVTESEFESFADKAGIGDKLRHQLREWQTGEPITAGQKRAILKMTEQWLLTKQAAILGVAKSLKSTLDKRYPTGEDSDVILPRGYEVLDLFNVAGASFDLMTEVPRSSKGLIEKSAEHKLFFGVEDEAEITDKEFNAAAEYDEIEAANQAGADSLLIPKRRTFRNR